MHVHDRKQTKDKRKENDIVLTYIGSGLKKLKEKHHLGTNNLLQHSVATEWRLIGFFFIYNPFLSTQENKCMSNHIHTIKVKGFFFFFVLVIE